MIDFNFLKRLSRKSDPSEPAKANRPVTTILEPKQGLALGRRLAFSVGQGYLAMATVRHVGTNRTLIDLRGVKIPAGVDSPESRTNFISDTLTNYVAEFGGGSPQISISVSGWETAYRSFLLPVLSQKEMAAAVRFEASKQLPFPVESCIFDHRPIAKIDNEGKSKYQICLQAATLRLINGLLEPFSKANIAVSQINTGPEVMGELLKCLKTFRGNDSYTMVEVTPDRSITSFYQDGSLVFSFVGSVGTDSLPEHATDFDLDTFAEALIDEIQVSQDYFGGQRAHSSTNQVFVYGSLEPSEALLKHLNGRSGLEFAWFPVGELIFPVTKVAAANETPLANLSALASAINRSRLANLLPDEHRAALTDRRRCRWSQAAAAVMVVVLGLSYWGAHKRHATAQESAAQIETELGKLKESEAYRKYYVIKRQIAADLAYLNQAQQQPSYLHLELKEISHLSTPGITLDNLSFGIDNEEAPLIITGRASSSTIPPEVVLAEYVESLRASKLCDKVEVRRYLKRKKQDRFEIEFTIGLETTIS